MQHKQHRQLTRSKHGSTSGEDNHLATAMDPQSRDERLTHHSGGRHGDVEPSGDDLPSGRVPGRAPEPSQSWVDDDGDDGTFRGILIGSLGFLDEGVYMGEGLTPGEPCDTSETDL